nr:DUF3134 domain-containing protein [Nostoc sp. FACHB-280]
MSNPALHEEPRYQPAAIIPLKQEQSLLDWLASTGRLEPYVFVEHYYEDEEDDAEEVVEQYEYETGEIDHLEE